ncbi:PspA-associated protein PspAB [Nocardiopsis sp. NPDC055551]|uniref:PspA-associated protein PspAB n=1 Tax=Nocardiopsis sp. NPDC006832 TaxID=3157188 RepID=UPI00340F2F7F
MSFWRALLGRSKPAEPDLDALFGLPTAALTLRAGVGLAPTGSGSVAFRAAEGAAFADVERDVTALLDADEGPPVEQTTDDYGYTWLVVRGASTSEEASGDALADTDISGLVTDLHAVNSTLEVNGYGPSLLCSLVGFTDGSGRSVGLVYLYKRGTFYPFAPAGGKRRDNALELQVEAAIGDDLPMEKDRSRWFPVYGAPGL